LKNLRISTQLSLLVVGVSVMLLGIGLFGLYGMGRANDALRTVYEDRAAPIEQLADMNALQLSSRLSLTQALLHSLPAAEAITQIERNAAQAGKLWELYLANPLAAHELRLAKAVADARTRFMQDGLLPNPKETGEKIPYRVLDANLSFNRGALSVQGLNAGVFGGTVSGSGTLDPSFAAGPLY